MRALIQRVTEARVDIDERTVGQIGPGLLILVCAMQEDTEAEADRLATRISKLRIFKDDDGRMNRSLVDVAGQALIVSQFTLAADTKRGNRPGFSTAAAPQAGEALYHRFVEQVQALGIACQTGVFGADMQVRLVNDGPVTIWMDTSD